MKASEKAHKGSHPADDEQSDAVTAAPAVERPGSAEVTSWLLDGRFFTIDLNGSITSWSPAAAETFGWNRRDVVGASFVETVVAPQAREREAGRIAELFADGAGGCAGFTGALEVLDADGGSLSAAFAMVPIQLGIGYEFNALLQEVSTRSRGQGTLGELRKRHESVLDMIEGALSGRGAEAAQTEEGGRLAGALVVFEVGGRGAPAAQDAAVDNVVSIAEAGGLEEAHSQIERARRDAEEARVELRSLQGQLEEARREAQRSRNEVDQARQDASDARDALALAQREAEEVRRQLEDARRLGDELRAQVESARIRSEDAERESGRLRAELREARDAARGAAGRVDEELAEAQAQVERSGRELAEARAGLADRDAELHSLRERLQEARRELGTLRAEAEAARAEAAEGVAAGAHRAAKLERLQEELGGVRSEITRMRVVFEHAPVAAAIVDPDGHYVDVNAAFCDALGHPAAVLLSEEPPAIVHPDDVGAKTQLARRILAGKQRAARGYRRYVHADGHTVTMRETVSALPGDDGRPTRLIVQLEEAHGEEELDHVVIDADVAIDEARGEELVLAGDVPGENGVSGDAMRRALEDDLFELHCQPLLDLHTNEVEQYELLIRMVAEDGRRILPEAFLGPARRAGLAQAIDRWVVRQAIQLIHEAGRDGRDVTLEVNLSPEAVHDPDLPRLVEEELATMPIDPARLVLEVTGATAVEHLDETRTMAKHLRGLGCRFALDDFRSTFGSFRLLKDLPLDYLKLDGELVGSLSESRTSQLIVKALVDVAAGTGTKTVAVFVSDDDTLALLRQQGVDYAQGYKVGRPRPAAELWPGSGRAELPPG